MSREWLRRYDPRQFPPFAVTVDLAVFTVREKRLCVLLVRRGEHPYLGWWALPGGHLRQGSESCEDAAWRELREETGVDAAAAGVHLEQLKTYSAPNRDPRMDAGLQVVSVAYVALAPDLPDPVAGTDARQAAWWPVADALAGRLAFDHGEMLTEALERVRAKLEYTTLAMQFVAEPFTLADLRGVYMAVWGHAPDLANFRRKVLATPDFVRATAQAADPARTGGRPAELYVRGLAQAIVPPLIRRG